MKILFLTNFYPPVAFGGYERLCFEVASAMVEKGHSISVLTSSYGNHYGEDINKHDVHRELFLFATEGNLYKPFECSESERINHEANNRRCLASRLQKFSPDVIFVWNLYFLSQDFVSAIQEINFPTCYLLTDNWLITQLKPEFMHAFFLNGESRKDRLKSSVISLINEAKMRLFAMTKSTSAMKGRAIFPSRFMRQMYKEAGFRFKSGQCICYHGIKASRGTGGEKINRDSLTDKNQFRLLFAGRIVQIKGVHTALKALKIAQKRLGPSLQIVLTVVGDRQDTNYFNELDSIMKENSLYDRVFFRDPVEEDMLSELFQEHDIYLFPSLYEPFSLTLIHALASGIPTIASDAGGNIEIVHDYQTGLIFKAGNFMQLADKICHLASNHNLRKRLGTDGSIYAARFSFDNMISTIEKELLDLCH